MQFILFQFALTVITVFVVFFIAQGMRKKKPLDGEYLVETSSSNNEVATHMAPSRLRIVYRACFISMCAHFGALLILLLSYKEYKLYGEVIEKTPWLHYCLFYLLLSIVGIPLLVFLSPRMIPVFSLPHLSHASQPSRVGPRSRLWYGFTIIMGGIIYGLAGLFFFVPRWLTDYFTGLSGDQLVFLLTQGGGEATKDVTFQINNFMVAPVVFSVLCGFFAFSWHSDLTRRFSHVRIVSAKKIRGGIAIGSAVLLVVSGIYAFNVLPVSEIIASGFVKSQYIEKNYIKPTSKNVHFPEHKRNVLHIYMESVEASYFDKEHGGYMSENLMPELTMLAQDNISFSQTNTLGGPTQTYGSVHSIAAMINMWAGVPMKSSPQNGTGRKMNYPGFATLGDIYSSAGYETEFMLGARARWGGLGEYYKNHGNFTVFDYDYAREHSYIPQDYKQWWGYEDDKLYSFAQQELTRLSEKGKPFYFVLENADTHFPDGYVSKNMTEKPFSSQYANVIHYSQKEVVKFVEWARTQPWWENTTVVITGDHRSMDRTFFKGWDPQYERSVVNIFINAAVQDPGVDRTRNRSFAPFDFFPTILAASGVHIDGDRLGLGTNLFSDKKTLLERDGVEKVNTELSHYSSFYADYPLTHFH